jgi:hypothetical protein
MKDALAEDRPANALYLDDLLRAFQSPSPSDSLRE